MEDDCLVGWARGLAPDPARAAAERADRHRILSSRAASETERYRTILTLYLKSMMQELSGRTCVRE